MIALLTFAGIFLAWLVFGSIIAKIFGRTVRTWVSNLIVAGALTYLWVRYPFSWMALIITVLISYGFYYDLKGLFRASHN